MLLVRLALSASPQPRYGCVRPDDPDQVELLDGDPIFGQAQPNGQRLPYRPLQWQAEPRSSAVRLLCPVVPQKIVAVGSNYRNHAREMGKPIPQEPLLFLKPPSALLPPGEPIVRPAGYQRVDYEGELAVVVGRRMKRLPPEEVASHILGYTALNDVTVRDLQKRDGQFTRAKGFDSFCPLGPAIATAFDPAALRLCTRLNQRLVQDSQGDEMIFPVYELVAFISHVMTLEPGDVISTGTPAGVGDLQPGDVVEIAIDGIGTLRNPVVGGPALPALPPR